MPSQPESTDTIPVMRSHLVEMYMALERCLGYFSAHDLAEAYRTSAPTPRPSRIQAQVNKALDHAGGYLDVEPE